MYFAAAFLLFAVLHSLLASRSLKRHIITRWPQMRFYYRFLYNIVALLTFALVWFSIPVSTSTIYSVDAPFSYIMHLVQLLALYGIYKSVHVAGTGNFTGIKQLGHAAQAQKHDYDLDEPKENGFVVQGPFKFVRHPLYLFSIIFFVFHPYMTVKWLLLTVLAIIYFIIGSRFEEMRLTDRFGDAYKTYKMRVPAILPDSRSFSKLRSDDA
ncbi:MAG: isoprenylcysteine carboxylmethyltransferase family protein [Balneolia bacterium]|nr:isoprenylcysteine carboxylmethyltransferase family protein [Balneolia bacterium]